MGLPIPYGDGLVKKAGEKRMVKPLASSQIRAARAIMRWTVDDLAREAALGRNTILRAEAADDQTSLTAANDLAVRRALEAAGVEFIDEDGGGPGVRLRKRRVKKTQ
jgi:DNA-binding XRE family transcriptional regulator